MTEQLVADKEIQTPSLPEHLIALPGGQWAAWRCVGLRGAGFPAEQVLQLAAPECAVAADHLLQAEAGLARTQNAAQDALHRDLDEMDANGKQRKAVKKVLRCVNKAKLSEPLEFAYGAKTAVDAFYRARIEADAARMNFERIFAQAIAQTSQAIYNVAGTDRFREAVTWQNRHALLTGINSILRKPPETSSRDSKRRQHEELIANYLQRYCVKNDTIGFFGPVGWARFVVQGETLVVRPGPDLLASREVYFEGWCVDAIAEALGQNGALRPWLAPRHVSSIYVEGTKLYQPCKDAVEISAQQAVVLQLCDGERTAREIALRLIGTPSLGFEKEEDVYHLLEQLQGMQLIVWALEVPLETYPERTLRRLLERIEDKNLRQLNLRVLDVLERARSGVALAAGDAAKLDQALEVMNTVFVRLTGVSSKRAAGKTYAARTLVYEDCRRDVEVNIGPEILQALGPPLSLLLESTRWFAVEAAAIIYRIIEQQVYKKLAEQTGSSTVPLVDAWPRILSTLYIKDAHILDSLLPVFQERWARILSIPDGVRRVAYSSQKLRPHVMAMFETLQPGWSFTRYQSPDVLVAASSVQDVRRGDYQLVMGELHMGKNTLNAAFFAAQHPSPEELFQALANEYLEPRIIPIVPKHWPELTARTRPAFVLPRDFRPVSSDDALGKPEWRMLPIGALVAEYLDNELVVRTRDGRLCFGIIEFITDLVADRIVNFFKILRPAPHTPRVTIDRLVVGRETWRFPAEELTFVYEKDESDRFVAARRWAQTFGIPRFAFVKTPVERKPFYVDFDSPIFVNIFAKYVRRTQEQHSRDAQISVVEMLPDPSQTWLIDAKGQRYTSEFRIVCIDSEAIMH